MQTLLRNAICSTMLLLLLSISQSRLNFCLAQNTGTAGGALRDESNLGSKMAAPSRYSASSHQAQQHQAQVHQKVHTNAEPPHGADHSGKHPHSHTAVYSALVPSDAAPHMAAVQHAGSGSQSVGHPEPQPQRSSFNLLSEAMSQAVSNEFNSVGSGSADGSCHADDFDCYTGNVQDRLGMEAIASLHRQLDDDDNGNIDLSESDDFLREELKYHSGYEKRQKAFHFNDDGHISVKELWEAWLRSEVHNWTIEQTTDWLAQSVQLPQYVDLFKLHKVTGAALPRLAVNNLHYVSNVLGIKDPIHKQKISLKAMDVVLFGPPRETGTRWKDYILVTLLLSAIIGCWYAYQQNKNAKRHLRRMAQDMEGLQRAEQSLQEMQKELERARMEQENVATEKMDLERRLKEAPSLKATSSDLEVQQLKKEIEMLRNELSRAEFELVDNCWAPPPQLQSWLQYTYEVESKSHQRKRVSAEKQLQTAREACEKLRKKRSSLVGAFVSTHGKSIDDVDRSIVEARNALGEVTNELQERLHRWKQIETCLGLNIVNNNGLPYLESVLYGRNGGIGSSSAGSTKGSRARITSSTDDLDDDSVQGMIDSYGRNTLTAGGHLNSNSNAIRDDSSCSDDGIENQSVQFYLGSAAPTAAGLPGAAAERTRPIYGAPAQLDLINAGNHISHANAIAGSATTPMSATPLGHMLHDSQMLRSHSTDLLPMEIYTYLSRPQNTTTVTVTSTGNSTLPTAAVGKYISSGLAGAVSTTPTQQYGLGLEATTTAQAAKKMVKQHSTASQQSTSSTSSSVQSAPPCAECYRLPLHGGQASRYHSPARWSSHERAIIVTQPQQKLSAAGYGSHHSLGYAHSTLAELPAAAAASVSTLAASCSNDHELDNRAVQQVNANESLGSDGTDGGSSSFNDSNNDGNMNSSKQQHNSSVSPVAEEDCKSLVAPVNEGAAIKKRKRRLRFPFGGGGSDHSTSRKSSSNESGKSKLI